LRIIIHISNNIIAELTKAKQYVITSICAIPLILIQKPNLVKGNYEY